jgi:hypothetical protein
MTLEEQIYAQALLMAGRLSQEQDALLRMLCRVAKTNLEGRLRSGLTPEDLRADFVAAGSLVALAALSESDSGPERFTAGELTVQRGSSSAAAKCLRGQAELLLMPYVRDSFAFLGV